MQTPVSATGLPQSTFWLQQDAAPQPMFVFSSGEMAPHTSLAQLTSSVPAELQQMAADPEPQGLTASIDVGRLKAVLQEVLSSLPVSQPASSSSAAIAQQLQGPGALLELPQPAMPAQYVQAQPQQQVYVTPSGQQVVLVGGGPPMMLQDGPACAYAAAGSSAAQLAPPVSVPFQGVLGGVANNHQILISATVGQGLQAMPALINAEVPQVQIGPDMIYSAPLQLGLFDANISNNLQLNDVLGAGLGNVSMFGANQALQVSGPIASASIAGSHPLVISHGPAPAYVQEQQLFISSMQAGLQAGNALGNAGEHNAPAQAPGAPGADPAGPGAPPAAPGAPAAAPVVAPAPGAPAAAPVVAPAPGAAPGAAHAAPGAALAAPNAAPAAQGAAPAAHAAPGAPLAGPGAAPAAPGAALAGPGAAQAAPAPVEAGPVSRLPAPWASTPLREGLRQLWGNHQLRLAKGGRMYNTAERTAWQPQSLAEFTSQDLFSFPKLKFAVQKLDAVHTLRLRLIKRLHAVADYGDCELRSVYFEVRCIIGELLHSAHWHRLEDRRVTGFVRLALALQEALSLGPAAAAPATAAE